MAWNDTPCEPWGGHISNQGYGLLCVNGQSGIKAHVYKWTAVNGPVPDGLVLDHLCRNRACCNPNHLEPVTPKENTLRGDGPTARNARKTHCKRGHELTGDNVKIKKTGWRMCMACQRLHQSSYMKNKRQAMKGKSNVQQ